MYALSLWDQTPGLGVTVGAVIALLVAYLIASAVYSLTVHPLAGSPGPISTAVSRIPFWIACVSGRQVPWMQDLHNRYGPLVRYGPNDLSFADHDGSAWKAIHTDKEGGREFEKPREWFVPPSNGIYGINSAPTHEDHRRYRKVFAPAFSERAMKQQEPIFRKYIDMFMSKLSEKVAKNEAADLVEMFQFTSFDIMAELTFGEPLGLLEAGKYSHWVQAVFDSIKVIPIAQLISYYPMITAIFNYFEPQSFKNMKYNHFQHSADRVDRRLKKGSDDPDIWNLVLSAEGDLKLSLEEMYCHADVFMLAGTETTGTTMSALTYYLLDNTERLVLLTQEIRGKFSNEVEITMESIADLKYLNACINEALRLHPPVPVGVPRVVPESGRIIAGTWIAPGTRVAVDHYSTYHSPANFQEPDAFRPERWLGDPAYENDKREVVQPFGVGPRGCIGKNMALHEMRLVLALTYFKFDLKLDQASRDWTKQNAYILWDKKPLMCHLSNAAC